MSDTYFNIVRFVPDSGGDDSTGAAVLLESPFKRTAGIRPDFNRAVCSYTEYANLGGQLGITGTLQFCFNDDTDPDVTIEELVLLDAEPMEYGIPAGESDTIVTKYRLIFTDKRWAYVEPRGGRLYQGILNPSTIVAPDPARTNVPATISLADLITYCLKAMGITSVAVPAVSQLPPNDLKWLGTHAPTELGKLLAMADLSFALQNDGTFTISSLGEGADPTIPEGMALPVTTLSGADGRGKTVVFTSYPTQVMSVFTEVDLLGGGSDFAVVAQNANGAWVPIDQAGVYGSSNASGAAIAEMNAGFPNTHNPRDQHNCYRFIRLDPNLYDPLISPILRKCWAVPSTSSDTTPPDPDATTDASNPNGLPPQIDIDFRALVAVYNSSSGQWTMPTAAVRLPVIAIYDGNVLELGSRLVKLSGSVSSASVLETSCAAINLDTDMQIRFALGSPTWNAPGGIPNTFQPLFFYSGFSGTPDEMTTLDSADAQAAMNDANTIVITMPELTPVIFGLSQPIYNKTTLVNWCQGIAPRYLQDADTPPRLLAGVGFIDFVFNGVLSEVEIDQSGVMTKFKCDSWFRPVGSYLAREFERLRRFKESHPHETKTAGTRTALGSSAVNQPVQPIGSYQSPGSSSMVVVHVNSSAGGGIYGGTLMTGTANGSSGSTITGMSAGATVIIYNGPELGTSSTSPYLASGAGFGYAPGIIIGKDAGSGNQIVLISATGLGAC